MLGCISGVPLSSSRLTLQRASSLSQFAASGHGEPRRDKRNLKQTRRCLSPRTHAFPSRIDRPQLASRQSKRSLLAALSLGSGQRRCYRIEQTNSEAALQQIDAILAESFPPGRISVWPPSRLAGQLYFCCHCRANLLLPSTHHH